MRFELTDQTCLAIDKYLRLTGRKAGHVLIAKQATASLGLATRQYVRLVQEWVASIELDLAKLGTHHLPTHRQPSSRRFPSCTASRLALQPPAPSAPRAFLVWTGNRGIDDAFGRLTNQFQRYALTPAAERITIFL